MRIKDLLTLTYSMDLSHTFSKGLMSMKVFLDTDSYSDTDSTKHDFDLSNQTLNDC